MKLLKLLTLTASLFAIPLLLLWQKWQGMYYQYPVRCDGGMSIAEQMADREQDA